MGSCALYLLPLLTSNSSAESPKTSILLPHNADVLFLHSGAISVGDRGTGLTQWCRPGSANCRL